MSAQDVIGGDSGHIRELYHYSEHQISGQIRPNQYWTDFKSDDRDDISRVTGTPKTRLNYRSMARINDAVIDGADPWFTNEATKTLPGLGSYDEYKNRKPILPRLLVTVPL